MPLLKPEPFTFTDGDGDSHTLTISKFPATIGLEINTMFPTSLAVAAIPKLGDFRIPDALVLKIFQHVAIELNGQETILSTRAMVDNHTGDWEGLVKVILAIMKKNNSFFRNGTALDFFAEVVRTYQAKIIETLTASSAASSPSDAPPSTN